MDIENRDEKNNKDELIAIFVATHVKCNPPENPIYIPLHVGKYGKPDMGYIGDDTGENISDLNPFYAELTGLYWIWQNVKDIDYIGMCHYRRYFINEQRKALDKVEFLRLLHEYDAIVPKHAECEQNYREHFGRAHRIQDLDAAGRALKKLYPKYMKAYEQAMAGKTFYGGNLFVTSLPILKDYSEWLFSILAEAGEEIDVRYYDHYQRKIFGFLAEQMFYVYTLANGLKTCELLVGISEEKAETKELIETLKKLIAEDRQMDARNLFDSKLEKRPDLLLPGSDIHHELQDIYDILLGKV